MLRNRNELKKPELFGDFQFMVAETAPKSFVEAMSAEDSLMWKNAMQDQIDSLHENAPWELVQMPENKVVVDNRWICRITHNSDGTINRYKARLVIKGYS